MLSLAACCVAAGCGGRGGGSAVTPGGRESSARVRPMTSLSTSPWKAVSLVQPLTTIGGASADTSGAWVSDAAAGTLQRVTTGGATQFTTSASSVHGLSLGSDGIAFSYPAGYGDQPDASPATLFPVPLPSGAYFASGEIAYNTSLEVIYLGGYVQKNANCTDGIDAVPAGGTSGTPYLGNGYSTVCGPQFLRIDSTNSDVWFSEGTTPRYLADLSLSAGKVTDHHLPAAAAAAIPGDLAAGANGDIYFSLCNVTDSHPGGGNFMVRVNAGSTQQTLFSTYSTCANTVDSMLYDPNDGRVWLANDTNTLTAVRTTDGSVSTYTLTNGSSASSGFKALALGPDRALWAFRESDADAHAYPDQLIGAVPSYVYTLQGQPVTVTIAEQNYSGDFTAGVVAGSNASCTVTPIVSGRSQTEFSVASPPGTACTVSFSDTNGVATVYVPVVTATNTGIPPHPQTQPS